MKLKVDRVVWAAMGDELVALDLQNSAYFGANETAAALMRRLSEGDATVEELQDHLLALFKVDRETAASGVRRLLDDLRSRDLLED